MTAWMVEEKRVEKDVPARRHLDPVLSGLIRATIPTVLVVDRNYITFSRNSACLLPKQNHPDNRCTTTTELIIQFLDKLITTGLQKHIDPM